MNTKGKLNNVCSIFTKDAICLTSIYITRFSGQGGKSNLSIDSRVSGSCMVIAGHLLTGVGPSFEGIGVVASQQILPPSTTKSLSTANLEVNCQSNLLLAPPPCKFRSLSVMKSQRNSFFESNCQIEFRN